MKPMEILGIWIKEGPLSSDELESLIKNVKSTNPHLDVAECALAIGDSALYELVCDELSKAEACLIELITARVEGDIEKMLDCINRGLEIVRQPESRDLILEGRLQMERGLIRVQTGDLETAGDDLQWALDRLKSVAPKSHLHGLAIINKAAFHEHKDESLMALHHYGEIALNSVFPPEVIGFSRVGAARIYAAHEDYESACRHLWNANNLFNDAGEEGLAWHAGLEFLRIGFRFADPVAESMESRNKNATPRQLGEEYQTDLGINTNDLQGMAESLKRNSEILDTVGPDEVHFIDYIISQTSSSEDE